MDDLEDLDLDLDLDRSLRARLVLIIVEKRLRNSRYYQLRMLLLEAVSYPPSRTTMVTMSSA